MTMRGNPAIILLSGGLDSVTAIAWSLSEGLVVHEAISFTYGQRHAREIQAAAAVAAHYGVPHTVADLAPIRGSRLTDLGDIPQGRDLSTVSETIAPTYVPNRNMILISYAAARALLSDVALLVGGWNAADGANYPDCRDPFLAAAEQTLRLATERNFAILRPLIDDDKPAIVRRALRLKAPLELTWTCYLGGESSCGTCDACQLRIAGFRTASVIDPIPYAIPIDWSGCAPYRST